MLRYKFGWNWPHASKEICEEFYATLRSGQRENGTYFVEEFDCASVYQFYNVCQQANECYSEDKDMARISFTLCKDKWL